MDFSAEDVAVVAQELFGVPNKRLSKATEYRYGNHGSLSIDLKKATWFDNELNEGGGLIELVRRERGVSGRAAVEWLREIGVHVEEKDDDDRRSYNGNHRQNDRRQDSQKPSEKMVATFDYVDEAGDLLFQVCRFESDAISKDGKREKTFRQRRPDPNERGGWSWKVRGLKQVPYRLPDLIEAISQGYVIFIAEGEKAVEALRSIGVPATCNAGGAGKWPDDLTPYFADADVVILPDDDPQARNKKDGKLRFHDDGTPVFPGMDHARGVASKLEGVARRIRILELFERKKKEDAADFVAEGGTADLLYDLVETKARLWPFPPTYVSRFGAVTWEDIDKQGPEHEWLVRGIFARRERALMVGPSGSGKSFVAIDMALAIARGIPYFGKRTLHGGVVYQAGEGAAGLRKRIRAYMQEHSLSTKDKIPFVMLPSALDLYSSEDHTNMMIAEIKHWAETFTVPLELVVIDTLSAATPGANENDSGDIGRVLMRCARISHECKCTVLLVHHMNASGTKERGHSSIRANLDSVVKVERNDDIKDANGRRIHTARVTKQKDDEDNIEWSFVLRQVRLGVDKYDDPITSCVVDVPAASSDTMDDSAPRPARVPDGVAKYLRVLIDAIRDYGVLTPSNVRAPQDSLVLPVDVWRTEAMRKATREPDDTDKSFHSRFRQNFNRARDRLEALRVVKVDNDYIWLTGRPVSGFNIKSVVRPEPADDAEPDRNVFAAGDDEVPF